MVRHHHILNVLATLVVVISSFCYETNGATSTKLTNCLTKKGIKNFTTPSDGISFGSILDFPLQNLRFTEAGVSQPLAIILPSSPSQVKAAFTCIKASNLALRVRSGGHSYEGISSTAPSPFAIIDLMNLRSISVDVATQSVWAQSGATTGELYYAIASKTSLYGFSAGTCPTIGLGGHIAGGGFGQLSRKYGLAADNILDAQLITANGTLINSVKSADPDLFWALRGGGGGSWGIVVAWKLKLVPVPAVITTFSVWKTGKQAIADLVYKWQSVAPAAPKELFIAVYVAGIVNNGNNDSGASIYGQYLGNVNDTLAIMGKIFPELGLTAGNCKQGSWLEASANNGGVSGPIALLSRQTNKNYFKAKSDYVAKALTKQVILGALQILQTNTQAFMLLEPYGGGMSEITSTALPFPHRAGNLFSIQYQAWWRNDTASAAADASYIKWLDGLYNYMGPYVSYIPARAAYVNYIDLQLGDSTTAGKSYFGPNFSKLVKIKARVDPSNVFNAPQSIPTAP